MKIYILIVSIFYILLFNNNIFSQSVYAYVGEDWSSDSDTDTIGHRYTNVYKLNFTNKTFDFQFKFESPWGVNDIAIAPDGKFYGTGQNKLFSIDELNGTVSEISLIPNVSKSLVCNSNYELYFLNGWEMYKYNILTKSLEIVANINLYTPGDLTYYQGNLIFQSSESRNMYAYNLENKTVKNISCSSESFKTNCREFYGIANIFTTCSEETIIASHNGNHLYELNFNNNLMTDLNFDYSNLNGYVIGGLASDNEYLASNCSVIEQVDANCDPTDKCNLNDSILLGKNNKYLNSSNKNMVSIFPSPSKGDISVESSRLISSIKIYTLFGNEVYFKDLNSKQTKINIESQPNGVYFVKITFKNNTTATEKIILAK